MSLVMTDTHAFFWHGVFSQWDIGNFQEALWCDGPEMTFNCAEQYMMASKALLFGNVAGSMTPDGKYVPSVLELIMSAKTPKQQKALGRTVSGFDEEVWNRHAKAIVYRANMAKFAQMSTRMNAMREAGDRLFVEGSPVDRIWGVGMAFDNPAIKDPDNWRGTNWLGEVLTVVSAVLRSGMQVDVWRQNPFAY